MTPRYKLRTLLLLLAILPPVLWFGWGKYAAWRAEQDRRAAREWLKANALSTVGEPDPLGPTWEAEQAWQRHDAIMKAEQAAAYERAVAAERLRAQPPRDSSDLEHGR